MNKINDVIDRQKKNERLLQEIKKTRLIVKYNKYILKLLYKQDRTFIENIIVNHSISTSKLERLLKNF